VKVISNLKFQISNEIQSSNDKIKKYYIDKFIELVSLTAKRKRISFHSGNYYRKMIETIPGEILKLYVAEYKDKIVAANLVVFYGDTATYLHGATDDEYRNVMAPYLLQWQAIKDAKKAGCLQYDFGGVKKISPLPLTPSPGGRGWLEKPGEGNSWSGITKFKLGFAPNTEPVIFPGSYDIIIDKKKYYLYRAIQKIKCWIG
jgi:lipid II:glycine glycyltransferase (peptidoglycan interpeptide bridge formation enzyme)